MSEILCHCDDDHLGHELGYGIDCPPVKKGIYARPEVGSTYAGVNKWINHGKIDARGTCPVCRKPGVQVKQIRVFGGRERPSYRLLPPVENPRKERGYPLEIRPGMAPHKVRGAECPGTGKVPLETKYTPGRELAGYLALMAEENEEKTA